MKMAKQELKYEAKFVKKISRLFVFRFLYMVVELPIMMVWGIWIGLVTFVHFWYMLILGRRSKGLWKKQFRLARHVQKWNAYWMVLVDRRPEWIEK